ncbi:MAG TPA: tripartite tricarboxylate transporter substrate binding protein [Ramlibacter sp.]|nr:tripartite tricarboxylate transporter substrate binding protein [Ramlibacter sp.]
MRLRLILTHLWLALALASGSARADDAAYPERAVTVIVPFPAGGRADLSARLLAMRLQAAWQQPVTVQNRPGAGGAIGARAVADARPDGYTLLFISSALVSAQYLVDKAPRVAEFQPLGIIDITYPVVVARKGLNLSLKNLAGAGNNLTMGTVPGASTQIAADGFLSLGKLAATRIPFKGESDTIAALLGGHIDLATAGWQTVQAHVKAGQLEALGVAAPARVSEFPAVPTLREQGMDLSLEFFQGLFAGKDVPRAIATRVEEAVARVMADDTMVRDMKNAGIVPRYMNVADSRALITRQDLQFRELASR